MPNIKSAKKRVKVNSVKALNNQMAKSELKTTLKKFDAAIAALLSRSAQQRLEHLKRKDRESGLSREEQYEMVRLSIEVQGKR